MVSICGMTAREPRTSRRQRLTVTLDDDLIDSLRRVAESRGESVTETVRRALTQQSGLDEIVRREADRLAFDREEVVSDVGLDDVPIMSLPVQLPATARNLEILSAARSVIDAAMSAVDAKKAAERSSGALQLGMLGPQGQALAVEDPKRRQLITDVRHVSEQLMRDMARDPEMLHKLSGRHFEKVVADLLDRQGYDVTVVPPGPDGGVDIYAATSADLGSFLYLVQCKRWSAAHPVGLDVVQRLYGRVASDNANAGIVVTTSRFTKPAIEYADTVKLRLTLRDYADLTTWLTTWVVA